MSLPGDSTSPDVMSEKLRYATLAGQQIMTLLLHDITPSRIMRPEAFKNALAVNMAIGGSANSILHLPAVAHEAGFNLNLESFEAIARTTPHLCNMEPVGPYHIIDLHWAGGVPGVMKALASKINQESLTVTGKTVRENLTQAEIFNHEVIRSIENPVHPYGSIAILKGTLAPEGGVIKQVGVPKGLWTFTGPATVFDSEEEAVAGLSDGKINPGEAVVIRYEGPKGGPGMREMAVFREALAIAGLAESTYVITDGRFSGFTSGASIGYISPEAATGGPLALVRDGDLIHIDIARRVLDLQVAQHDLSKRRSHWVPPQKEIPRGYLRHFAKTTSSASNGSILNYNSR
jgi:dihydroxy-acid dehydratase